MEKVYIEAETDLHVVFRRQFLVVQTVYYILYTVYYIFFAQFIGHMSPMLSGPTLMWSALQSGQLAARISLLWSIFGTI